MVAPAWNPNQQNYFARNHKPRGLPPPAELAQRIEEAKTSAKLLSQVVQSTPSNEILGNELIKEFVERCQLASRSIQSYIHSDSPPPDEDTLLTLIETNDQISTALSRHQRSLLQARRAMGVSSSPQPPNHNQSGLLEAPSNPAPNSQPGNRFAAPAGPPPGRQALQSEDPNPFGDDNESHQSSAGLQEPLVSQGYGMPPATMANATQPGGSHSRQVSGIDDHVTSYGPNGAKPFSQGQQHERPRYRF